MLVQLLLLLYRHAMRLIPGHLLIEWTFWLHRRLLAPYIQATFIHGDNAQPVTKPGRYGEVVEMLQRLQKSLLGQVLGQVEVAQYTHAHCVHGLLIALHEGPEGNSVPLQGACHQLHVTVMCHGRLRLVTGYVGHLLTTAASEAGSW